MVAAIYTIDESLSDSEWTAPINVPGVFGGYSRIIESITIHHWGSFGQTHDGVIDWFVNRNPNTSAHFVVSAGRINCLVSPANAAWAAGNAYGNARSIHIECHPEATDEDYATVAWLVAWLREQYGANLPLVKHSDWVATDCPGIWNLNRIEQLSRQDLGGSNEEEIVTQDDINAIADAVLNRQFERKGTELKGTISLGTIVEWFDANVQFTITQVIDALKSIPGTKLPDDIGAQVAKSLADRLKD